MGDRAESLVVSLDLLDAEEGQLHRYLVADPLGRSVRLGQERVSFAVIEQAMRGYSAGGA